MENKLSIIIPTYNEENFIQRTIERLLEEEENILEIIVVDGGSKDKTQEIVRSHNSNKVRLIKSDKGQRSYQLNLGAQYAKSEYLLFNFADTLPPKGFSDEILETLRGEKYIAGCFRWTVDWNHWFLKFNSWFSRINLNLFRGGDQSLYLTSSLFKKINGYREDLLIMEDYDIVVRIRKYAQFVILKSSVLTSSRSHKKVGPYKIFALYYFIAISYILGVKPDFLYRLYKKFI